MVARSEHAASSVHPGGDRFDLVGFHMLEAVILDATIREVGVVRILAGPIAERTRSGHSG
jgi:hypothetical protein